MSGAEAGRRLPPKPAVLVCGLLLRADFDRAPLLADLAARFGPPAAGFGPYPFDSPHYAREMGAPLERRFLVWAEPFDMGSLAAVKRDTCAIEARFAADGRRRVNLDPGYVTEAKLVLASTKDNVGRIYLADGIYAEVTLAFARGEWRAFDYTYRDFRDGYRDFLAAARKLVQASRL